MNTVTNIFIFQLDNAFALYLLMLFLFIYIAPSLGGGCLLCSRVSVFSYGQMLETSFEFKGVIYIVSLCCLPLLAAQYYVCLFQCMICTDSSTMRLNIKIYLYAYLILTPLSATETVLAPHSVLFVEETTITRGHPLPSVDNGQILSLVCCIGYTSTLAGNSQ